MLRLTLLLALASLAVAATASAGGWATAGISPPPPDDPGGGSTWDTTINVLQHGRTPLDGLSPAVILRNASTGEEQRFDATPTGEPGKYAASVTFPDAGRWSVEVYDGFVEYGGAQNHTFGVVDIGAPAPTTGGGFPLGWTLAGVGAAIAAAAALLLLLRRRATAPAPASAS